MTNNPPDTSELTRLKHTPLEEYKDENISGDIEEIDFEVDNNIRKNTVVGYENKHGLIKKISAGVVVVISVGTSPECPNVIAYCDTNVDIMRENWSKQHNLNYNEKLHKILRGVGYSL
jgi:hypothetical protein